MLLLIAISIINLIVVSRVIVDMDRRLDILERKK